VSIGKILTNSTTEPGQPCTISSGKTVLPFDFTGSGIQYFVRNVVWIEVRIQEIIDPHKKAYLLFSEDEFYPA
jgi:hypothetical protein